MSALKELRTAEGMRGAAPGVADGTLRAGACSTCQVAQRNASAEGPHSPSSSSLIACVDQEACGVAGGGRVQVLRGLSEERQATREAAREAAKDAAAHGRMRHRAARWLTHPPVCVTPWSGPPLPRTASPLACAQPLHGCTQALCGATHAGPCALSHLPDEQPGVGHDEAHVHKGQLRGGRGGVGRGAEVPLREMFMKVSCAEVGKVELTHTTSHPIPSPAPRTTGR
jgi:hypothetical protein